MGSASSGGNHPKSPQLSLSVRPGFSAKQAQIGEQDANGQPSTFHMTPAPTRKELAQVLGKIITKITRLLERKGIIVKEEPNFQLEISEDDSFAKLQAGAVSYRFTMGPNKGKKALTLRTVTEQDHNATHGLVAKNSDQISKPVVLAWPKP